MGTAPNTEVVFVQERKPEHSDERSALFYLFQEVSKLASPIHNRFLDTNPASRRLNERTKNIFSNKKEEDDDTSCQPSCSSLEEHPVIKKGGEHSFQISHSTGQHSLSCMLSYNCIQNTSKESPNRSVSTSAETCCERNSPWKVLSLINLHCERLLHQNNMEELNSNFVLSSTQSGPSATMLSTKRDDSECILDPGCEEQEITGFAGPVEDLKLHVQVACAETRGPVTSELQDNSSTVSLFSSNYSENTDLSKLTATLDHNANIILSTELPCDPQRPPPSLFLPPSQSAPLVFNTAESCQSLSGQDGKFTASKHEYNKTPTTAHLNSSCDVSSATPPLWMVQKEGPNLPSFNQRRVKTRRKQPHPSRSADIQDPDFQGVTFRIDAELDETREHCRLLITSKYSKELCRSWRKPKLRTRTSQKSLKLSSSDEENDLTADTIKVKVCASCCTRKTPMWRDAEDGTPLCNACGIRYKKYRVRCSNCWHIPRKEGNSNSRCLKCGNSVKLNSAQRKHAS